MKHSRKELQEFCKNFWWIFLVVLLIPLFIYLLLYPNYPALRDTNNADWLMFWGSYLGASLGGIAAFIAIIVSYEQNRKQHEDNKDFLEKEKNSRDINNYYLEISHSPFFTISTVEKNLISLQGNEVFIVFVSKESTNISLDKLTVFGDTLKFTINDNDYATRNTSETKGMVACEAKVLELKNDGLSPATNIMLKCNLSKDENLYPIIQKDSSFLLLLAFEDIACLTNFTTTLSYCSLYERNFTQELNVCTDDTKLKRVTLSKPNILLKDSDPSL
jgi:hypothetical protein